jgi:class 3 adenylate cyclase
VVTFLFTDVEGSTRRWESDAQAMRAALVVHDKVLRTAIEAYDGFLFSHTGDGVCLALRHSAAPFGRRHMRGRRGDRDRQTPQRPPTQFGAAEYVGGRSSGGVCH